MVAIADSLPKHARKLIEQRERKRPLIPCAGTIKAVARPCHQRSRAPWWHTHQVIGHEPNDRLGFSCKLRHFATTGPILRSEPAGSVERNRTALRAVLLRG